MNKAKEHILLRFPVQTCSLFSTNNISWWENLFRIENIKSKFWFILCRAHPTKIRLHKMRLRDRNCSFCGNPEDVALLFLEVLVCWGNLVLDTRPFYSYLSVTILPVGFPSRRSSVLPHICQDSGVSSRYSGRSLFISCGERDVPKHLKKGSKKGY